MSKSIISHSGFFSISDSLGDFSKPNHGFFGWDTRFISDLKLKINEQRPIPLNARNIAPWRLTLWIKAGNSIFLRKKSIEEDGSLVESIFYPSFNMKSVDLILLFNVGFESIFEVRGARPLARRIEFLKRGNSGIYRYVGIDGLTRILEVKVSEDNFEKNMVKTCLKPGDELSVRFSPRISSIPEYAKIPARHSALIQAAKTDNSIINYVIYKSIIDMNMLTYHTVYGPIFLAGIPNFACVFGRDSILSALYTLPYYPEYALGTLKLLSKLQGKELNKDREEEPGKIPHEVRVDELSLAGKTVFSQYYGTVDATPLYVMLAGEYLRWTGDFKGLKDIAYNLRKAVEWILKKIDERGYITYTSKPGGLVNQGWKDSAEGVPYEDGAPVKNPVALVEVQGYAYAALKDASELADLIGMDENHLRARARSLLERLNKDFWIEELKFYALALDGDYKPSKALASNQGHLLYTDAALRKVELVNILFDNRLYSGWGIRTLSSEEAAYNPFSYHNGSVWPHDNAFIALGLSRQGFTEETAKLAMDLFEAGYLLEGFPELFSGLPRLDSSPCPVPIANKPQAWSAASTYAFISAFTALNIENGVVSASPVLPREVDYVKLRVKVYGNEGFLEFRRKGESIIVQASGDIKFELC